MSFFQSFPEGISISPGTPRIARDPTRCICSSRLPITTFQLDRVLPLQWKASFRLCKTSANRRTSLTSCIRESESTTDAPARWDANATVFSGLEYLKFRPISQVLVDPADSDPACGFECCLCRAWLRFVPPLLLLLFRTIPVLLRPWGLETQVRGRWWVFL